MRHVVFRGPLLKGEHSADGRRVGVPQALGERVRTQQPEPGREPPFQLDLHGVIGRRNVRGDVAERAEARELPPRLHAAGRRRRDIETVVPLNVRALVADVFDVGHHGLRELLLDAEIPVLVVAHPHVRVFGSQPDGGVRRPQRRAQIEIGQRPVGNHAAIVQRAVLQQERRHEKVHAAVRVLAFIEDAVAAAQHRGLTHRTPRETEARRDLPLVGIGDGVRQARFRTGLDQVLQVAVGDRAPRAARPGPPGWSCWRR